MRLQHFWTAILEDIKERCLTTPDIFFSSNVESEEEMKQLRDNIDRGWTQFKSIDKRKVIRLLEDFLKSLEVPIMPTSLELNKLGIIKRKFMLKKYFLFEINPSLFILLKRKIFN